MAQNDRHTDTQTDGHGDSMTDPAQRAKSVKMQELRDFGKEHYYCTLDGFFQMYY